MTVEAKLVSAELLHEQQKLHRVKEVEEHPIAALEIQQPSLYAGRMHKVDANSAHPVEGHHGHDEGENIHHAVVVAMHSGPRMCEHQA